jgi:hypothetical protein
MQRLRRKALRTSAIEARQRSGKEKKVTLFEKAEKGVKQLTEKTTGWQPVVRQNGGAAAWIGRLDLSRKAEPFREAGGKPPLTI